MEYLPALRGTAMGSTTTQGYPYPVGTDRVMDGDDAIKALAEALEADGTQYTKALTVGQTMTAAAVNNVQWQVPTVNGCNLTRTNAYTFTVTRAGLYVITATVFTTGFAANGSRAYLQLVTGPVTNRLSWEAENTCAPTTCTALAVGETITLVCWPDVGTSVAANTGSLNVARLGRS